jgi:hypothetical protein
LQGLTNKFCRLYLRRIACLAGNTQNRCHWSYFLSIQEMKPLLRLVGLVLFFKYYGGAFNVPRHIFYIKWTNDKKKFKHGYVAILAWGWTLCSSEFESYVELLWGKRWKSSGFVTLCIVYWRLWQQIDSSLWLSVYRKNYMYTLTFIV